MCFNMIRIAVNMKADGSKSDESDAAYQFQPESRTHPYSEKPSSHMPPTPAEQEMSGNTASDTESMVKGFEFSDATIRRGFIRKVYGILSVGSLVYFIRKTTSTYPLFENKFSTKIEYRKNIIWTAIHARNTILERSPCRRKRARNTILLRFSYKKS